VSPRDVRTILAGCNGHPDPLPRLAHNSTHLSTSNIITVHIEFRSLDQPVRGCFRLFLLTLLAKLRTCWRMLRYSIQAFAALIAWFTLSVMPANAGSCVHPASGIAQASHEIRATPQWVLQRIHHEHQDGLPCTHGNCSVCCAVCSAASVAPVLLIAPSVLVERHEGATHGPPPDWTLPPTHLTLLPFRPPRALA